MPELPLHPSKLNWGVGSYPQIREAYTDILEAGLEADEKLPSLLEKIAAEIIEFCSLQGIEMKVEILEVAAGGKQASVLRPLLPEEAKRDAVLNGGIELIAKSGLAPYRERVAEINALRSAYDEAALRITKFGRIKSAERSSHLVLLLSSADNSEVVILDPIEKLILIPIDYETSRLVEMACEGNLLQALPGDLDPRTTNVYYALDDTGILTQMQLVAGIKRAYPLGIKLSIGPIEMKPVEQIVDRLRRTAPSRMN